MSIGWRSAEPVRKRLRDGTRVLDLSLSLITGLYQTTLGAHHHRSGRGVEK